MSKERKTINEENKISIYCIEGLIEEVIKTFEYYKREGWQRVLFDYNEYEECNVIFSRERLENDKEFEKRIRSENARNQKAKKQKEYAKAERKKLYEKLKKEFEN
jgi:hypothetical protein